MLWLIILPMVPAAVSLALGLLWLPRLREVFEDFDARLSFPVTFALNQPTAFGLTVCGMLALTIVLTILLQSRLARLGINLLAGLVFVLLAIALVMSVWLAMVNAASNS